MRLSIDDFICESVVPVALFQYLIYRFSSEERQFFLYLKKRREEAAKAYYKIEFVSSLDFLDDIVVDFFDRVKVQPDKEVTGAFISALKEIYTKDFPPTSFLPSN